MRVHRAVATGSTVALNIIAVAILGVSAAAAPAASATTSGECAATAVVATACTNGMGYNFPTPKGMGYN
jgi:hypothetical protein